MRRITLGALDYGLAFGVDRALRELALNGRISAVGALVATDLWPREFKPLRETADAVGKSVLFGVTLAFSGDRVKPVSSRALEILGGRMPSREKLQRRAFLRLLPDGLLQVEAEAQLARYSVLMDKEPDFVAVREGLLVRSALAKIVFKAVRNAGFEKPPVIVSPVEPGLKALRLSRMAAKHGLKLLPAGPALPQTINSEELHTRLHHQFDGLADLSFISAIPGRADDRLRRDEPRAKIAIRECQFEVLSSGRFFRTLDQTEVFLR